VNGEGDRLAAVFKQGAAGPAQEALQVVRAGHARVNLDGFAAAALAHLDEGGKKVGNAVPELLDIGVLVG
jgi:hypothetical protein